MCPFRILKSSDLKAGKRPFMQLLRGDEPSSTVAVLEVTGLPPGVILHANNLEDVTPFKGECSVLAWNARILIGIIAKQSSHKQLRKENYGIIQPSSRQTGERKTHNAFFHLFIHISVFPQQLHELLYSGNGLRWCFFAYVGVSFEK